MTKVFKAVGPTQQSLSEFSRHRVNDSLLDRSDTVLNRELDQSGQIVNAELLLDAAPVRVHGLGREGKCVGDLRARTALDHQLKDIALPVGQALERTRGTVLADVVADERCGDLGAQIALAFADGSNRVDELQSRSFPGKVASRTSPKSAENKFRRRRRGQNHDCRRGGNTSDFEARLDTIQADQSNVEDCDIGPQFLNSPDGVVPVRSFANDLDVLLDFQQHLQTVQQDDAAIRKKHSYRHFFLPNFGSSSPRGAGSTSLLKSDSASVGNP